MATLTFDLKTAATQMITGLEQASPNSRADQARAISELLSMSGAGVSTMVYYSGYWQRFAQEIQNHKTELHPWLTVMGASTIVYTVFLRIVLVWYQASPPQGGQAIPTAAQAAIDDLIPRVIPLIAIGP